MTASGFSPRRLGRLREALERHVDAGYVPGAVAVVARHGEVHIEATGTLAFDGPGSETPMAADTIFRVASTTKPVVAACAMTLVEDCTLRLDDPVDEFLPELADMRVLADPDGPLDDTVPAHRPVTLRDLLTFTFGTGMVVAEPGQIPIADALTGLQSERPELAPASSCETAMPADEWIRRLGELPLVHQPGERWMYNTAANVTGVLIARATGMSFGDALRERVCEPLGMTDTGFSVAGEDISRLATVYLRDEVTGKMAVEDGPDGYWSRPPAFEDGGGGLVSTISDYLAFASALLAGGSRDGERVLSRSSVTLMTSDHLTPAQKAVSGFTPGYFDDIGWGFGMSVRTRRTHLGPSVGSYGWNGGYGTVWYNDPAEDMTTIVMNQGGAGLRRRSSSTSSRPPTRLWTTNHRTADRRPEDLCRWEDLPDWLPAWCLDYLGSAPADVLFQLQQVSMVFGLRLADGRDVVVKARADDGRAVSCVAAQASLAGRGFPCARPLTPAVGIGSLAVHAEEFRPGGEMLHGNSPDVAARYAEVFARLMVELAGVNVAPPLPNPPWVGWDHADSGVWPAIDFLDSRDQSVVPAFVVEAAERCRRRMLAASLPCVLGHADFEAQNLRWHGREVWAVHDWDSLAWQPEAALAGAASGAFASDGPPTLAPVESSAAFLGAYQDIRGRLFTPAEEEVAWAASLWIAAYNAREEALCSDISLCRDALRTQAAERLRRAVA